jgi:hypothetical protein
MVVTKWPARRLTSLRFLTAHAIAYEIESAMGVPTIAVKAARHLGSPSATVQAKIVAHSAGIPTTYDPSGGLVGHGPRGIRMSGFWVGVNSVPKCTCAREYTLLEQQLTRKNYNKY